MTTTDPTDTTGAPDAGSSGLLDRLRAHPRGLAVAATGVVVAVALVVGLLAVLGNGDDEAEPPPPPEPLALAEPTDLSSVFSVNGGDGQLSAEELAAITTTIEGYLRAASIEPLEYDPDAPPSEEGEPAPSPPTDLATFFTEAAAPRLGGDDRLALADDHLPYAEYGVSTDFARVTGIAALVDDAGAGLLAAATIDVQMRVRTGELDLAQITDAETSTTDGEREPSPTDAVVVRRTGELVLQPVDGAWKIGGYEISVTRQIGTATTTTEAAFGALRR